MIHEDTDYPKYEIRNVLSSLENVVKDKFSDGNDFVEMKLFSGLKVTSRFIPQEQYKTNLSEYISTNNYFLKLEATFSKRFKDNVRDIRNSIQNKNIQTTI